jgi:hypothetical protein
MTDTEPLVREMQRRRGDPIEVCSDCGAMSAKPCPYGGTTCSECSMIRERSVAGLSDSIPACPVHPYYTDPETDPDPMAGVR